MDFIPHRIIFAKQCHVISKEINLCKNCFEAIGSEIAEQKIYLFVLEK